MEATTGGNAILWDSIGCVNESTTGGVTTTTTITGATSIYTIGTYDYPWYCPTYYYPTKVRLTVSEVEYARKAAKKDAKLQAILQKFVGCIEVEVDF